MLGKDMKKVFLLMLVVLLGFGAGCYTPQFMPATNIECRVVDAESKLPIVSAELFMVYVGASGQTIKRGPFHTDVSGQGSIIVDKEAIWQSGAEAGFAGGYTRHIEVKAPGYESSGFWENFDRGLLEKNAPFVFELKPFRNLFGAVRVVSHTKGRNHILHLEVLDGPDTGEELDLPFMSLGIHGDLTGKKLYLLRSIAEIEEETEHYKVLAHNFTLLLREGFSDEPYESKKE